MNYKSTYFPSETSLFAQDQTDSLSDSNGAGYRCTCPHLNPPAHPPVTPPLNCIAILLARGLLEISAYRRRLPRVHRTYSGFADCRVVWG
jgi:hypothetical protein